MKTTILLSALLLAFQVAGIKSEAQETRNITGVVTSFKNIPLNNVKVYAMKSGNTQFTDSAGRFSIKCTDKDNLIINASGFREKNVKIGKDHIYQVDLPYVFTDENFSKAVKNNHISYDVLSRIVAEEKDKNMKDYSKYTSIFEAIDVEIYEVRVSGTNVYNNKIKSMNLNPQVLYVVDDKIVTDISYLNPIDVKSIEFIDDVGTTLYGQKGANGVLKIYLK